MYHSIINDSININIKTNKFIFEKNININKKIYYPFIINHNNLNYIYYRFNDNNYTKPEHETTKRFILYDYDNILDDNNYKLKLGISNHNFRLFNFNEKIYGVGGQALMDSNYNEYLNTNNEKYINYHKLNSDIFLNNIDYNINNKFGNKFYDPKKICPYHANGLHLFLFYDIDNHVYITKNNELPIISGIMNGRYDGHYGFCDNKNIEKSKNGLTVFDSTTSVLFNKFEKKYYLYQRANINTGNRYIQYSTSNNLINWSEFNLININPIINLFKNNFYYNNFFYIDGINTYIGMLPRNNKLSDDQYDLEKKNILNYITQKIVSIGIILV